MSAIKTKTKVLMIVVMYGFLGLLPSELFAGKRKGNRNTHHTVSAVKQTKAPVAPADEDDAEEEAPATGNYNAYSGGAYNPYMANLYGTGIFGVLLPFFRGVYNDGWRNMRQNLYPLLMSGTIVSLVTLTAHLLENENTGDKFFSWFASFFTDQNAKAMLILHFEEIKADAAPHMEELIFDNETHRNVYAAFDSINSSEGYLTSILLYGPPGTGKTALATSAIHKKPMKLFKVASHHLIEAKNLEAAYKWSIELSKKEDMPVGIIVEEAETLLEALLQSSLSKGEKANLFSMFKTLLGTDNKHILWIFTTNRALQLPMLPEACLRRFKHQILIGLPDCETRSQIFLSYLKKKMAEDRTLRFDSSLEGENLNLCDIENFGNSGKSFDQLTEKLSPDQIKITSDNIINFTRRNGSVVLQEYAVPFLESYRKGTEWLKHEFEIEYADEKKYLAIQADLTELRNKAQAHNSELEKDDGANNDGKAKKKKKRDE